jgi:hypothetical protein
MCPLRMGGLLKTQHKSRARTRPTDRRPPQRCRFTTSLRRFCSYSCAPERSFRRAHKSFDPDQVRGLGSVVLGFALLAALFVGMYSLDRAPLLQQVPLWIIMLFGYSGLFIFLYLIAKVPMHHRTISATTFSFCMSSSAVPICGLAVFKPLYGAQAPELVPVGI